MRPDIEHMSDEELQALSFDIVWGDEARLEMGARDMKRNVEAMSDTSKLLMDMQIDNRCKNTDCQSNWCTGKREILSTHRCDGEC